MEPEKITEALEMLHHIDATLNSIEKQMDRIANALERMSPEQGTDADSPSADNGETNNDF